MNKNDFIQQASIQMMATTSVEIAILVTQGLVPSKQEVTINGVIDAAEQLWQELKKRGYGEPEEENLGIRDSGSNYKYEAGDTHFEEEYS